MRCAGAKGDPIVRLAILGGGEGVGCFLPDVGVEDAAAKVDGGLLAPLFFGVWWGVKEATSEPEQVVEQVAPEDADAPDAEPMTKDNTFALLSTISAVGVATPSTRSVNMACSICLQTVPPVSYLTPCFVMARSNNLAN